MPLFDIWDLFRIVLAVVAGGLLGLEREFRDKPAGFRTLVLISMASATFTILSSRLASDSDPTRIAANIVTGIGFLGAGAILREGLQVTGLTTAATIWLAAAIGMAIGGGQYGLALMLVAIAMIVLWIFNGFEVSIDRIREEHVYKVGLPLEIARREALEDTIRSCGLKIRSSQYALAQGQMFCILKVQGAPARHIKFQELLIQDSQVESMECS
jgi:putative Mg2+ transporter-C (MgtC) family protein